MKRFRTLSILLVVFMMFSITSQALLAAEYGGGGFTFSTIGSTEVGVLYQVDGGTAVMDNITEDQFQMIFTPYEGMYLNTHSVENFFNSELQGEGFTYSVEEISGSLIYTFSIAEYVPSDEGRNPFTHPAPQIQEYFDRHYHGISTGTYPGDYYVLSVVFTETKPADPEPITLYTVRAASNPAGVAVLAGYGTGFTNGEAYNVTITSQDSNYVFTGWSGSPSGTIDGADVELVANFELIQQEPEEPVIEEPIEEEPIAEEPVTEEPVEEPADEEPATEEPTTEEPVKEESATEEPTEEPVIEEPVEEPVEEEIILDEEAIPEDLGEALPETGGIPAELFTIFGLSFTALGFKLKKK